MVHKKVVHLALSDLELRSQILGLISANNHFLLSIKDVNYYILIAELIASTQRTLGFYIVPPLLYLYDFAKYVKTPSSAILSPASSQ